MSLVGVGLSGLAGGAHGIGRKGGGVIFGVLVHL